MGALEQILEQSVRDGKIPHAVVFATNKDGSFTYKHCVGNTTLDGSTPIGEQAEFALASSSKLPTAIATMQIIERGLFGLDDDVTTKLPELGAQPVLMGFDADDKPIFEKRKGPISLRQMLTHTSGISYTFSSPDLDKYVNQKAVDGAEDSPKTMSSLFGNPLVHQPGARWTYGPSPDWAGRLIEVLTGQTLDEYIKENISKPLGVDSMTFWPNQSADLTDKIPSQTLRQADGKLVPWSNPPMNTNLKDCFGGHGLYANMDDYVKMLRSLLANDGKLLKPQTVDDMFKPHMGPEVQQAFQELIDGPFGKFLIGELDEGVKANFGLGSMLFMQDGVGRRKKGTLSWGGAFNTFWIIDREADLALTFGTQVTPPGDDEVSKVITEVERHIYQMAGVKF